MKIKIFPTGQEIEAQPNKSLLLTCLENGVHINSICKGVPKCAECRIKIKDGEHNVLPPTDKETGILGTNWYLDGRRLSCQVKVYGEITVDVSEQMERDQLAHKKVRGFRDGKHQSQASVAKLDTFVLKESSGTDSNSNSNKK